ncbi:hypothetical protein BDAP_002002 [Binucleata daphniae]
MIKKEMSYEKMTVIELKKLCGNLKISVTNKKKIELIAMLIEHDKRISEKIINEEKINEERLNEERLNEENEKQMRCEKAIDVKTKDERGGICTVQIHNEDTKQEKSTTENLQENTDVNVNDATTSVNSIKIVTNILVNDINFFEQNKNNNEIGMKKLENKTKSYEKHLNEELEEGEIYKRKRVKTNEYEKEYKILYKLTDNNLQKLANMSEAERIEARKKRFTSNNNTYKKQ